MFGEQRYGNRVPSKREQRVIELVAQGLKNREVADAIGTTEHVVKNYLRIIYDKLGLWNRVELALWYEARRQEVPAHAWGSGKLGAQHSESRSGRKSPQFVSTINCEVSPFKLNLENLSRVRNLEDPAASGVFRFVAFRHRLSAAARLQAAQLFSCLWGPALGGSQQQKARLIATLRNSVAVRVKVWEHERCRRVLLAYRFPQKLRGFGGVPRTHASTQIALGEP
jgi:DNA-binding CsgD family transcriptional regulator